MKQIIAYTSLALSILVPLGIAISIYVLMHQLQENMIYLNMERAIVFTMYILVCPLSAYGFYNMYKDLMYSHMLSQYRDDSGE